VVRLPQHAQVLGALSSQRRVTLTVSLQPRDPVALSRYATAVSTPGSRDYGRTLTVPQFARRFGAPHSHIAAVRKALRRDGLTIGKLDRNDLTLAVSGSARTVEHAFQAPMFAVRVAGRRAFANSTAATLPGSIARYVQAVNGFDTVTLDNAIKPQVATHHPFPAPAANATPHVPTNGGPQPCPQATLIQTNEQGLTADSIATAYGFPALYQTGDFGQGQTIGLFEIDPDIPTDPATYFACYGIAPAVTVVNVNGGPAVSGDDGEVALDIEVVAGIAPQAAIDVYQGSAALSAAPALYGSAISANVAKILSASLGACEANDPASVTSAENTLFQEAAAQGQTMLVSSGDQGSAGCDNNPNAPNTVLAADDPASQPFVTGVGGTTLFAGSAQAPAFYSPGAIPVQGPWNDGANGGSPSATGGGVSSRWTMPAYQSTAAGSLSVVGPNSSPAPCAATAGVCREVPDVSANADPSTGYAVFATTGGQPAGWTSIGGTSAASPLWAAFIALANDQPSCRGLSIGFANPLLYAIASASYNNNFTDISAPHPFNLATSNDALGTNNGLYPIATGYDMATGLGTMTATLAGTLCADRAPVFTVSVASPGTVTATAGTPFALQMAGADSGSAALSYAAAGLPAGLAINPATGVISGTPTTVGNAAVTVSATDAFTNTGSVPFAIDVVKPVVKKIKLKPSKVALAGLGKRKPTLSFQINGKTAVKSFAVSVPKGLAFAKKAKALKKGVTVTAGKKAAKLKLKAKKVTLTVTLKKAAKKVKVTIHKPALTITRKEASKIKHHTVRKLALKIKTTSSKKTTSTTKVTIKKLT
jgi:subtilase family serine protease